MMTTRPTYEELESRVRELERKLSGRLSFEYLIKYISTSFINLSVDKIDAGINRALRLLSEFIEASMGAIYTVSPEASMFDRAHFLSETSSSEGGSNPDEKIPFERFGYFREQLCRSEFVIVNQLDDIPQKAALEREWYEKSGHRSLLIIPMILENRIYGLLSFSGPPRTTKHWPEEFIVLIRLIADRFMNLLNRKKYELALIRSKKMVESLLNATSDSAMLIGLRGTVLAINTSFSARLGKDPSTLTGLNIHENFPQGLPKNLKTHLESVIRDGQPAHFEDEHGERTYYNVVYPVMGSKNTVEKLAYYSHDISNIRRSEYDIRTLTNELIKSQEKERLKIAAGLHDNVAQELASLRIHCDALFDEIPEMPSKARGMLSGFSKTIKNSIETVREMAYELQPPGFDNKGLVETLYRYCEEFSHKNGIQVDFYTGGMNTIRLDFTTENNIHRLVQEALNNVRLHSGASQVVIRLVATSPNIILRIEDNGKGFDLSNVKAKNQGRKKVGLKAMEGRVKLMDGTMKVLSRQDKGTRIVVEIPFNQDTAAIRRSPQPSGKPVRETREILKANG
jgi:signal transduction histidine kinase